VEPVFTVSLKGSHGPASGDIGSEWLTAAKRHRTTVVRLPEPYGRRRCLGIAEQHRGWLGPIARGKTVNPAGREHAALPGRLPQRGRRDRPDGQPADRPP
jgi:hypothetical protein